METDNTQIQFSDPSQKPKLSSNNKIFLIVIGLVFIIVGLFYFLAVRPAQICTTDAKTEADRMFKVSEKARITLPISDKKTAEQILLNQCLQSKGMSANNNVLANPIGLLVNIFVEFVVIFLYLFIFSNQYESNVIKFYRALILAAFLIVVSAIGHAFGLITLLIAAIFNLIAIMFILQYSFTSAFLFSMGLEIINYLVAFLILSALK